MKRISSLFAERSNREVFSKGPRSKQSYDRLILGIQTTQALLLPKFIHHLKVLIFVYFLPNILGRGITRKRLRPFQLKTTLFGRSNIYNNVTPHPMRKFDWMGTQHWLHKSHLEFLLSLFPLIFFYQDTYINSYALSRPRSNLDTIVTFKFTF